MASRNTQFQPVGFSAYGKQPPLSDKTNVGGIIGRYIDGDEDEEDSKVVDALSEPIFGTSKISATAGDLLSRLDAGKGEVSGASREGNDHGIDGGAISTHQQKQQQKENAATRLKQVLIFAVAFFSSDYINKNYASPYFSNKFSTFSEGAADQTARSKKYSDNHKRPQFVYDHPYVSSSYYTSTKSISTLELMDEVQVKPKRNRPSDSERGITSRLAIVRPFCEFDAGPLPSTFACWNSLVPCRAAEDDLDKVDENTDEWVIFDTSFNDTTRNLLYGDEENWECESNGDDEKQTWFRGLSQNNMLKRCKRKPKIKSYFDDVPADGLRTTSADLFLFYSQTFSDDETAMRSVDEIMNEFFSPGGWSRCFDNIYAIEANIPKELDLYIPAAQEELYNWVNGPNRQFEAAFRVIQSGEWGQYDGFYLMEGDSVPVKNYWLDVILGEINEYRPFAVLGAQYDGDKWDAFYEQIPISLLHHTNGNGIYNTSHPLLERLVGQLEVEAPCPYNSIPYDYRMSQMWVEGTLGIVPKLAPKIMLNEEGQNITLSDNTAMFAKWAKRWQDEEPYRFTKAIHNYAATNLIPRHLGPEYVIHGAKLYSPWDPSRTEITLVVSEWFFDRSLNLIRSLDSKDHPFSKVIIMIPPSATNDHDYSTYTKVPVTLQFRDAPDFMDLCSAEVSTEWFMITNSYHLVANHVDLMFTPGKFIPVIPFTPATYPFCLKYPYCNEIVKLSQRWNPGHKQVVQDMDMLYNTKQRNEFCNEWIERNGENGEDLYIKHEPVRYRHRGEKIIGPKGPTGTDYFAYLIREKKDGMYKMTDRSLYGARAPFVKVYRKEEKLDGMSEDDLVRRLGMTLLSNTTECSCERFENEEDCVGSGLGCLWRPLFESCHPPEMIDDGVPICETTDAPTMSPSVSIQQYLSETAAPTVASNTSESDSLNEDSNVRSIEDRSLLDTLFKSQERTRDLLSNVLVFDEDESPQNRRMLSNTYDIDPEISIETMEKLHGSNANIESLRDFAPVGFGSALNYPVARMDETDGAEEDGLKINGIEKASCPTWGPSIVPHVVNDEKKLESNAFFSLSGNSESSQAALGSRLMKSVVPGRSRHWQHKLSQLKTIQDSYRKSVKVPTPTEIRTSQVPIKYGNNLKPLRIKFETKSLTSLIQGAGSTFQGQLLDPRITAYIEVILPSVAQRWSEVLAIFRPANNVTPVSSTCGNITIPDNHLKEGVPDSDVVIYIDMRNPLLCSTNASPQATICQFDQNMRPVFGVLSICLEDMEVQGGKVHDKEILRHIAIIKNLVAQFLGLSQNLFRYFRNPETGELWGERPVTLSCGDDNGVEMEVSLSNMIAKYDDGDNEPYYEIKTPSVRQIVRNHFDCQDLTGARLSAPVPDPNNNDECTFFNLDLRFHFDEDMTSISQNADAAFSISPLSLALLEDSSWYLANFTSATTPTFGRGAGCGFVKDVCISDGEVPAYSAGFYCNSTNETPGSPSGCDHTHRSKAGCDVASNVKLPSSFQYFGDQHSDLGSPYEDVRHCPMRSNHLVSCTFQSMVSNIASLPGETFEETSRCFETDVGSPVCLETVCNAFDKSLDVVVNGKSYHCSYSGEMIDVGLGYSITCPRIAVLCPDFVCPSDCSGKGVCDYCKELPSCICDDPFDDSPGCWAM